ncbi:MAG: ArsR family transcriptional regulator [Bacteroidetes bacterium]|nr:MAG: ArsR family transcriptional regulator [Bacteroidota bacterium]
MKAERAQYAKAEYELAAFTKAIAHPARIAILNILAKHNTCICGQIVDGLPLAQATVSQHLKALKNAGLIKGSVSGPKSCYCINWDAFEAFKLGFNQLFSQLNTARAANCC